MHVVRDGERTLQFDGELLAASTSRVEGRPRWIEFYLYRTAGKQYVLARVGRSEFYHTAACSTVKRNSVPSGLYGDLPDGYQGCASCRPAPESSLSEVHIEQPRYWAQLNETADSVVASLFQYDEAGSRYLTNVARRLLTSAGRSDPGIHDAFMVEHIA